MKELNRAGAVTALSTLLSMTTQADPNQLTPRQKQGLAGSEAVIMLCAHPGKLDADELQVLAQAGLIFGAVLAGER